MKTFSSACRAAVVLVFTGAVLLFAQPPGSGVQPDHGQGEAPKQEGKKPDSSSQPAFRIDQPGTITFTVGMVIKGKIEKPQVIIFLPKEKTYYRDLKFTHSFADEIITPLPFSPVVE
jgi:hypothetical protein